MFEIIIEMHAFLCANNFEVKQLKKKEYLKTDLEILFISSLFVIVCSV